MKILIIEDDEFNLELVSTILKINGYKTLVAKNGLEGIRLAMTEKPHLILMDIQMPVMDGIEAIKILKSELFTKDIPSIAISAHASIEEKQEFLKLGFVDYVAKPFNLKNFINVIEQHLSHGFPLPST